MVLQQRLDALKQQKTLTSAEKHEMQQLLDELSQAQGMSDPKGAMIHYYCNPPSGSTAPNPQYPTPPRCGGFTCLDNR